MLHIKRLELSHFKSFGGTTKVPLLPGFTVVSGPNGSGKSNILDALLFALGLASSRVCGQNAYPIWLTTIKLTGAFHTRSQRHRHFDLTGEPITPSHARVRTERRQRTAKSTE